MSNYIYNSVLRKNTNKKNFFYKIYINFDRAEKISRVFFYTITKCLETAFLQAYQGKS